MGLSLILAVLGIIVAIGTLNFMMISWIRDDASKKAIQLDAKLERWTEKVDAEMRDFHGRLCEINERTKAAK